MEVKMEYGVCIYLTYLPTYLPMLGSPEKKRKEKKRKENKIK